MSNSHQPFHWFAEYYEIIHDRGGFDIIIGNPPYVVYTKKDSVTKKSIADNYQLKNHETLKSNNLYAYIIERCNSISSKFSLIGMIIPISSVSSEKFESLQKIFREKLLTWQSSYSNRPGKLFENVEQRLTIFVGRKFENKNEEYFSASYKHWYANTRLYLFDNLFYSKNNCTKNDSSFTVIKVKQIRLYNTYQNTNTMIFWFIRKNNITLKTLSICYLIKY